MGGARRLASAGLFAQHRHCVREEGNSTRRRSGAKTQRTRAQESIGQNEEVGFLRSFASWRLCDKVFPFSPQEFAWHRTGHLLHSRCVCRSCNSVGVVWRLQEDLQPLLLSSLVRVYGAQSQHHQHISKELHRARTRHSQVVQCSKGFWFHPATVRRGRVRSLLGHSSSRI